MIPRTEVEKMCLRSKGIPDAFMAEGYNGEIKIYARENRNYDITKEKKVEKYTYEDVQNWDFTYDHLDAPALCTLIPDSCVVTEELQGTLEATFTVTKDKFGKYKYIQEYNYVEICNNLFYIYKINRDTNLKGDTITAYCLHVTYLLKNFIATNYCYNIYIYSVEQTQQYLSIIYAEALNAIWTLTQKQKAIDFSDTALYIPKFKLTTNYANKKRYSTFVDLTSANISLMEALIGNENSFINLIGGELYRYNFYLSINKKKEDCKENAFSFYLGYNIKGIKRTIDYSDFCTSFVYRAEVEEGDAASSDTYLITAPKRYGCPTEICKIHTEKYSNFNDFGRAKQDAKTYYNNNYKLKVKYDVSYNELSADSKLLIGNDYRVGDSGYIFDETLGETLKARITKIVKDGITGNIKSMVLKCNTDYEAEANKTQYIDSSEFVTQVVAKYRKWGDVKLWKWGEAKQRTWKSLKGE